MRLLSREALATLIWIRNLIMQERVWRSEEVSEVLSKYLPIIKRVLESKDWLREASICVSKHILEPVPPKWSERVAVIVVRQDVGEDLIKELHDEIINELPSPSLIKVVIVNEEKCRAYAKALGGLKCYRI